MAVVLGKASGGLTVRDFDSKKSYQHWAEAYPDLAAELPTVKTSRGFHVYIRSDLEIFKKYADGEVRGTSGQYVLAPPARHPSGLIYQWVVGPPRSELPILDLASVGFLSSSSGVTEQAEQAEQSDRGRAIGGRLSQLREEDEGVGGVDVEGAIEATLPTGPGQRNRRIFDLCRTLKSLARFCDADPRDLKPVVRRWHELAMPVIGTKGFEESWHDFLQAWPRVKFHGGENPMDGLVARAFASDPPASAADFEDPTLLRLACLCLELQRAAGSAPFFLACRTAGRLLAVSHRTAWKWLNLLRLEGLLEEVTKGSQKTGKASRYRWTGGA